MMIINPYVFVASGPPPEGPVSTKWRMNILLGNNGDGTGGAIAISTLKLRVTPGGADQTNPTDALTAASALRTLSGNDPYRAFDNNQDTGWAFQRGDGTSWLEYDFPTPLGIVEYAVQPLGSANIPSQAPYTFTLEYYDGTKWVILDYRNGETGWTVHEERTYGVGSVLIAARYWRLRMLADSSSAPDVFTGFQGGGGGYHDASSASLTPASTSSSPNTNAGSPGALSSLDSSDFAAWNVGTTGDYPSPIDVITDLGSALIPRTLQFSAGGSPYNGRNPTKFEIAWSVDNTNWTTIQSYTGVVWGSNETKSFLVQ